MRRERALRLLSEHRDEIHGFGVKSLAIFGSVARDEAGANSDVDLLVEFKEPVGFFRFLALQRYLAQLLGSSVDLVPRDAVKRRIRDQVLSEAVDAA